MLHSRRSCLAPILALVIASVCAEARGGFVTYTVSTPSQMATNSGMTLSVPMFDSSMGTLQSVTMSFSDSATLAGTVVNHSARARNAIVSDDVSFSVSFLGTQVLSDDLSASRTYKGLAGGATETFGTYSLVGDSGATTISQASILTSFVATNTLDVTFSTSTTSSVTGGAGFVSADFQNTMSGSVTVTYNFIPPAIVPEPASLAMTALGGLLIATAGYFRSRARAGTAR